MLTRISEMLKAASGGTFTTSFVAAGVMLAAGAVMSLTLTERKQVEASEAAVAMADEEYEEEDLALE